ncbi:MAG: DUF427 domain-containing protein [Nitrospirota bacterium]|nr:MAG: DUF427 domain-containing protein [Nitrospirota bacterium]
MNPHAILIEKNPNRVKITFDGKSIADTQKALVLREGKLPPVLYLPREDVDMTLLRRTDYSTHCPFKGNAAYYSIIAEGKTAQDAVWTYESPIPAVAEIKDYLAFYKEKMDAIEERSE